MASLLRRAFLLAFAGHVVTRSAAAQSAPRKVPRYDDADEYLPLAERRNRTGMRLFLRQQEGEELFKVLSPRNVTIDVVSRVPPGAAFGVVMLLGGTSVLSITDDRLDRSFSFQPRSRDAWWRLGFATFLVDAPSDRLDREGIQDPVWRAGPEHRKDLEAVLAAIGARFKGPLVAHGHSNGAVSLANLAQLKSPQVKAYLYTSGSHAQRGTTLIYDVEHPAPVLLVQHSNDSCVSSPTSAFGSLQQRLRAPERKVLMVEGGAEPMSGACGPFAPHSFVGIEAQTVERAVAALLPWLGP